MRRASLRCGAGRAKPSSSSGRKNASSLEVAFGALLRLSPLEFRLLDYLTHQNGRAVSSGELADHLYGTNSASDANTKKHSSAGCYTTWAGQWRCARSAR